MIPSNIANYYSGIQASLAVTNGVVTGTGLVLAFQLKEDRYDAQYPFIKEHLYKRMANHLINYHYNIMEHLH